MKWLYLINIVYIYITTECPTWRDPLSAEAEEIRKLKEKQSKSGNYLMFF